MDGLNTLLSCRQKVRLLRVRGSELFSELRMLNQTVVVFRSLFWGIVERYTE